MSSTTSRQDDDAADDGFRRRIREASNRAYAARCRIRSELPNPTAESRRAAVEAFANYRDLLSDYHDEDALETPWDERDPDVDVVDKLLTETCEVEQSIPGRGHAVETQEVVLATVVDVNQLFRIGKELDAIARELGHAAAVADSTHRTQIDEDLIKEVEKWRKQNLED